ncbi:hypothetical protein HMI54_003009 [Coelomomyces lativittatus]|nr:hypothetical protein HMI54_003009 [Coelomomyces lativittatus]
MSTVANNVIKKTTLQRLHELYTKKIPITMVTAHDYPSAMFVDRAGADTLLVGDSLGMVALGYDTTVSVTMEEMLHHCRAVARGAKRPFLIGDMPFGSYEASSTHAVQNALRMIKEGNMEVR